MFDLLHYESIQSVGFLPILICIANLWKLSEAAVTGEIIISIGFKSIVSNLDASYIIIRVN